MKTRLELEEVVFCNDKEEMSAKLILQSVVFGIAGVDLWIDDNKCVSLTVEQVKEIRDFLNKNYK